MPTLIDIPLDASMPDALIRDRGPLDPAALSDLATSIAVMGLRQPVEVWEFPEPMLPHRYGLISGLRRLTACRTLRDIRQNGDFATIPALLCAPAGIPAAMAAMVTENELRAEVTPWEKGCLILATVAAGLADSHESAIAALYPTHQRQKRARLRDLAAVVEEFDGAFTTPERLTAQRIERLAAALRGGLPDVLHAVLAQHRGKSLDLQWSAILPTLSEALTEWDDTTPRIDGRPRRLLHLRQGLTIRREKNRAGWALIFSGPEARRGGLMDDVMDEVERWFQRE